MEQNSFEVRKIQFLKLLFSKHLTIISKQLFAKTSTNKELAATLETVLLRTVSMSCVIHMTQL